MMLVMCMLSLVVTMPPTYPSLSLCVVFNTSPPRPITQMHRDIYTSHEASMPRHPSRRACIRERESHNCPHSALPTQAGSSKKCYWSHSPPAPGSSFTCRQSDRHPCNNNLRTKKEKGEFFLSSAGPCGEVCAHCLGAHDHMFTTCKGKKLWDRSASPIRRGEQGKLVNADGVILCFDWQLPTSCQNTHHSQCHKCSGCRKSGHGAQTCPQAETA